MPHHPASRRARSRPASIFIHLLYSRYHTTSQPHQQNRSHQHHIPIRNHKHNHSHNDVNFRSSDQYEKEGLQQIPCKTVFRRRMLRGHPSRGTGPGQEARGAHPVLYGEQHIILWVPQVHRKGHKSISVFPNAFGTDTDRRSATSLLATPQAESPARSAASPQARTTILVSFLGLRSSLLLEPAVPSRIWSPQALAKRTWRTWSSPTRRYFSPSLVNLNVFSPKRCIEALAKRIWRRSSSRTRKSKRRKDEAT